MVELLLFIALALLVLVLYEVRERKQKRSAREDKNSVEAAAPAPPSEEVPADDTGCCGQHLVCERETLLQTNAQIEYYDDEELDALAGRDPLTYTAEQNRELREVFNTLQEKDVAGWVRSLQLRNIALPADIREEALLIVRERRAHSQL